MYFCLYLFVHVCVHYVGLVMLKALVYECKVSDLRFIAVTCGSKVKWTKCEVTDLC